MFVMSWDGIIPVSLSRSVCTVLFHGQNAAVTVYSVPGDGRKERPKHVEHTCSC